MSVKLAVKRLVLSRDLFDSKTLDQHWKALLPHGSPFGDPGTHGDLYQILGPQRVSIFIQGPHFHYFRLMNALKVRAATI